MARRGRRTYGNERAQYDGIDKVRAEGKMVATPQRLPSGDWGVVIPNDLRDKLRAGDTVTVVTGRGKSWEAQLGAEVRPGQYESVRIESGRPTPTPTPTPASTSEKVRFALSTPAGESRTGQNEYQPRMDRAGRIVESHGGVYNREERVWEIDADKMDRASREMEGGGVNVRFLSQADADASGIPATVDTGGVVVPTRFVTKQQHTYLNTILLNKLGGHVPPQWRETILDWDLDTYKTFKDDVVDGSPEDIRNFMARFERAGASASTGTAPPRAASVSAPTAPTPEPPLPTEAERSAPPRAASVSAPTAPTPEPPLPTEEERSAARRFDYNIEALRLSRELREEGRPATSEERAVLVRFSGFGDSAFNPAFSRRAEGIWARRREGLQELTTDQEFEAIEGSRLNANFTSPEVVSAMWAGLEKMGLGNLERIRALEPSAGSGRFLGGQPSDMARKTQWTAVELEPSTATLLHQTYPQAQVYAAGFQAAPVQDEGYDVAISNVPFGNYPVFDPNYDGSKKYLTGSIHNYFFAKTMDKLRPGGVLAFVTTHHTLDAPEAEPVREYLYEKADLVGAFRLPRDAFNDTKVVTDVIYLRKRSDGEERGDDSWVRTGQLELENDDGDTYSTNINEYYIDNPDKVLGEHAILRHGMYEGNEYGVVSSPHQSLGSRMEGAVSSIAMDAPHIRPRQGRPTAAVPASPAPSEPKGLTREEKQQYDRLDYIGDAARRLVTLEGDPQVSEETLDAARADLRERYDAHVGRTGEALNTPENHTLIGRNENASLVMGLENYDAENDCWVPADILHKRVIGAGAVLEVRNAYDAMQAVQIQKAKLDFEAMGEMLGISADEVRGELAEEAHIYLNPESGQWEPARVYLSGNVREKMAAAAVAAAHQPMYRDNVDALEKVQPTSVEISDIQANLGAPWIPDRDVNGYISETLGVSEKQWYTYDTELGRWVRTWTAGYQQLSNQLPARANVEWGHGKWDAEDVLEHALAGNYISESPKIPDDASPELEAEIREATATNLVAVNAKVKAMREHFSEWAWQEPERAQRLHAIYNDTFNSVVPRTYDGSHLSFPGMSLKWQRRLHDHQRSAIRRTIEDGTALLAHEVGFGKTNVMAASAMERKRLGLANKIIFAVPNATVGQLEGQFRDLYPGAKLLVPQPGDLSNARMPSVQEERENPDKAAREWEKTRRRQEFLARAATGDWDGIIMTTEQFEAIPLSAETERRYKEEEINALRRTYLAMSDTDAKNSRSHKDLQKAIRRKREELEWLLHDMKRRKDFDGLTFEELGVDMLYVDEAHRYKNLGFPSLMRPLKGLPGIKGAQRSTDMHMKVRYLQEQTDPTKLYKDRGVVFATGTPVSNSVAETWTMMRYLQDKKMRRLGMHNFDAWAASFGRTTEGLEQTAAGNYKITNRFSHFHNLPELAILWQNVADVRVASEVPQMLAMQPRLRDREGNPQRIIVEAPPYPGLENYTDDLEVRAANLKAPVKGGDNMLSISTDARKASLDLRMVNPTAGRNPSSKVALAAVNVARIYNEETPNKGIQFVFLDYGTPKAQKVTDDGEVVEDDEHTSEEQAKLRDLYNVLRRDLEDRGIPSNQIAFIQDYDSQDKKLELLEAAREGEVRVLVGSTQKLGTGINAQDRAAALHHIDAPWKPADLEQREGRIIRQGNTVYGPVIDEDTGDVISTGKGVEVYQYVQKGSFDEFMWQTLENKARAIKALMKREGHSRTMEDVDDFVLDIGTAKALASGDPRARRRVELDQQVGHLKRLRQSYQQQQVLDSQREEILEQTVANWTEALPRMRGDAQRVQGLEWDAKKFSGSFDGKQYVKKPEAGKALAEGLSSLKLSREAEPLLHLLGRYQGFDVKGSHSDQGFQIKIVSPETGQIYPGGLMDRGEIVPDGIMARVDNIIKRIPGKAEETQERLDTSKADLEAYRTRSKQWPMAGELYEGEREMEEIERSLEASPAGKKQGEKPTPDSPGYWGAPLDDSISLGKSRERHEAAEVESVPLSAPTMEAGTYEVREDGRVARLDDNRMPMEEEEGRRVMAGEPASGPFPKETEVSPPQDRDAADDDDWVPEGLDEQADEDDDDWGRVDVLTPDDGGLDLMDALEGRTPPESRQTASDEAGEFPLEGLPEDAPEKVAVVFDDEAARHPEAIGRYNAAVTRAKRLHMSTTDTGDTVMHPSQADKLIEEYGDIVSLKGGVETASQVDALEGQAFPETPTQTVEDDNDVLGPRQFKELGEREKAERELAAIEALPEIQSFKAKSLMEARTPEEQQAMSRRNDASLKLRHLQYEEVFPAEERESLLGRISAVADTTEDIEEADNLRYMARIYSTAPHGSGATGGELDRRNLIAFVERTEREEAERPAKDAPVSWETGYRLSPVGTVSTAAWADQVGTGYDDDGGLDLMDALEGRTPPESRQTASDEAGEFPLEGLPEDAPEKVAVVFDDEAARHPEAIGRYNAAVTRAKRLHMSTTDTGDTVMHPSQADKLIEEYGDIVSLKDGVETARDLPTESLETVETPTPLSASSPTGESDLRAEAMALAAEMGYSLDEIPDDRLSEALEELRQKAEFRASLAASRAEQDRLDKKTGTKGINEVRKLVREVQASGATDIPGMLQHYIDWFGEGGYQGRGLSVRQRDLEEVRRLHAEVIARQPAPPETETVATADETTPDTVAPESPTMDATEPEPEDEDDWKLDLPDLSPDGPTEDELELPDGPQEEQGTDAVDAGEDLELPADDDDAGPPEQGTDAVDAGEDLELPELPADDDDAGPPEQGTDAVDAGDDLELPADDDDAGLPEQSTDAVDAGDDRTPCR